MGQHLKTSDTNLYYLKLGRQLVIIELILKIHLE
jgi:hypothetical protein